METKKTKFITKDIVKTSIIEAFKKLNPKYMMKNPVMFVVEIGFIVTLILTIVPSLFGDEGNNLRAYNGIVTIILFITVLFANFAEAVAEGRGKAQADTLKKTRKDTVARVIDTLGNEKMISASELKLGDIVLVNAGEVIPNDGEVIEGIASVDESAITGESAPVMRESGGDFASVTGGTTVVSDWLKIRITTKPGESFLDKMIALVEGASRQKTPNEIALNTLLVGLTLIFMVVLISLYPMANYAGVKIPISTMIALLVCLIPTTIGGLLSAIGIAGMDRVTRFNVIAMSGKAVEACGDVDTMILDKTGTITEGKPSLTDVLTFGDVTREELLHLLASSEQHSEHPLAIAILEVAKVEAIPLAPVTDFQAISGKGIAAHVEMQEVLIGNENLMRQYQVELGEYISDLISLSHQGKTAMFVALDRQLVGMIAVADQIKKNSRKAIAELQKMGLEVVMLTGDREETAQAIAREAGVNQVIAGVFPDGKADIVKNLQAQGKKVAMVGDGINDAPALVQAEVGIAIGSGTDVAIDSADIVLMHSDLLVTAIRLSQATIKNIKENLFWAFAYNTLGIPIAMGLLYVFGGPLLNPMLAGLAMSFSSVSVVTNALRLRRFKIKL